VFRMMGSIDQCAHPLVLRLEVLDFDREGITALVQHLRASAAAHREARTSIAITRALERMIEKEQPEPRKC
jgi:hypothetical protein